MRILVEENITYTFQCGCGATEFENSTKEGVFVCTGCHRKFLKKELNTQYTQTSLF